MHVHLSLEEYEGTAARTGVLAAATVAGNLIGTR